MDGYRVEVVDAGRWDDVEALFGRAGADNGCWCQYWLLGAGYHRRDREENRADLRQQTADGTAGLMLSLDREAVGWARLTPRAELRWLHERFRRFDFPADDAWSLPCFFVARHARGRGAMTALVDGAVDWARRSGTALEAYPVDPAVPGATRNRFSGVLPVFGAAGFEVRGRLAADRVLVRLPDAADALGSAG